MAGKAKEAALLLQTAESGLFNVRPLEDVLGEARRAETLFQEAGDSKGAVRAKAIVVGALFRMSALLESPEEALSTAETQLKACADKGDRFGEAVMKVAIAEINMDLRRNDDCRRSALEFAKDAKAAFIDLGERALEGKAAESVSMVLIKMCDRAGGPRVAKEAIKFSREAAGIAQELGNRRAEGKALYLLFCAKMYCEASFRDGLKYAKEAASAFAETGSKWWQGTVLRTIADWAQLKNQGEDGIKYAEEALKILREVEDLGGGPRRGWEASALATLVGAYASKEDGVEKAVEVAKQGVERLRASGDLLTEAQAWNVLMSAHMVNDEIEEALDAAENSLAKYRELGQKMCEARMLREVAELHVRLKNKTEALATFHEGIALAEEIGDVRMQARNLSAVLRLHLDGGDVDKALQVGTEALELYQSVEDREGQGVVLLNMSSAHVHKEQVDVAIAEAEEARRLFQEMESRDREAQALQFLADIRLRADKPALALQDALEARGLFAKTGSKAEEAVLLHMVAHCHMAVGEKAGEAQSKDEQRRARKCFSAALRAGKDGLAIARHLPIERDPKRGLQCGLLIAVAQAQGILGKYKDSLRHIGEVQRFATEFMDRECECSCMILLAQVHFWNGKTDDARVWASNAVELARKLQDEYLMHVAAVVVEHLDGPQDRTAAAAQAAPEAGYAAAPAAESAAGASAGAIGPYAGPSADALVPKINELALNLLSVDDLPQDQPLMDSGLDSLSMVQFRNTLQQQFPGVPMPASLIFDHPSVRAVAENIVEELKAAHDSGRPIV